MVIGVNWISLAGSETVVLGALVTSHQRSTYSIDAFPNRRLPH